MAELMTCSKCGEDKPETEYRLREDGVTRRKDCRECCRTRAREGYRRNREERLAKQREWHAKNRERVLAYQKSPEVTARRRARYERDGEAQRAYHREWSRSRTQAIRAIKADTGCVDCGIKNPVCLDFDHLPGSPKSFNIGNGTRGTWDAILAEIAKCEVVCANCHRIRTDERRRAA